MIVLRDKPGQLGNRLWSASLFADVCHRHQTKLFAPYHFLEYPAIFQQINQSEYARFAIRQSQFSRNLTGNLFRFAELSARKLKAILRLFRVYWASETDSLDEIVQRSQKGIVFVDSFKLAFRHIGRYRFSKPEVIRSIFRFNPAIESKVEEQFQLKRKPESVLVGVHLRKRDYINYRGGRYYFENDAYRSILSKTHQLFDSRNQKVQFLMCSDEPIPAEVVENFDWFGIDNASAFEDMAALSRCDYMIGPPSSFSNWAAFAGNVPLYSLQSAADSVTLEKFKLIANLHTYTDGTYFDLK